ncbi:MAG: Outer rane lipoprotein, partial [Bacteroidota bacterium]
ELYKSACLMYMKRYDEAQQILDDLDGNDNYKEYKADITGQRLRMLRLKGKKDEFNTLAKEAEKLVGFQAIPVAYFENAMSLYKEGKYDEAKHYFAKSKTVKSPVMDAAGKYFGLITEWSQKHEMLTLGKTIVDSMHIDSTEKYPDSVNAKFCYAHYQLARIHDQLNNKDSAKIYYKLAYETVRINDTNRPQYFYSYQKMIRKEQPELSDSLLEILAYDYGKTEYGREARQIMGFTEAVTIDTLAELYSSGVRFRKVSNYILAARQFNRIAEEYRDSPLAPKALYSLGWMFENNLMQTDSALHYYRILVERYPQSEYAKDIRAGVEIGLAYKSGIYDVKSGKLIDRKPPIDSANSQPSDSASTPQLPNLDSQKQDNSRAIIQTDPQQEPLKNRKAPKKNMQLNPSQPMQLPANAVLPGSLNTLPEQFNPQDTTNTGNPP